MKTSQENRSNDGTYTSIDKTVHKTLYTIQELNVVL